MRRIAALLMLLTLLPLWATAQSSDMDNAPWGTWHAIYRIQGGTACAAAEEERYVISAAQVLRIVGGETVDLGAPVREEGTYLVHGADGRVLRFTPAGENLLTLSEGSTTLILQPAESPQPPANPFLGDWQVLMYYIDGAPVTSGEGGTFFDVRFGPYSVSTLVDGVVFSVRLCTYANGQCIIGEGHSQTVCTLDGSGMMTMRQTRTDVVCFLLPVAQEP